MNDYTIARMYVDRRIELQHEARDAALARGFRARRRRRRNTTAPSTLTITVPVADR